MSRRSSTAPLSRKHRQALLPSGVASPENMVVLKFGNEATEGNQTQKRDHHILHVLFGHRVVGWLPIANFGKISPTISIY